MAHPATREERYLRVGRRLFRHRQSPSPANRCPEQAAVRYRRPDHMEGSMKSTVIAALCVSLLTPAVAVGQAPAPDSHASDTAKAKVAVHWQNPQRPAPEASDTAKSRVHPPSATRVRGSVITPVPATPAQPATGAAPAKPGTHGQPATPAMPAVPATPATPPVPTRPVTPPSPPPQPPSDPGHSGAHRP